MSDGGERRSNRPQDDLAIRVQHLRAFGTLRRFLRVAEDEIEIAAAVQRFAIELLGFKNFAIYWAEKEDAPFQCLQCLLATPGETMVPEWLERNTPLIGELERHWVIREQDRVAALAPFFASGERPIILGLGGAPEQLIGIAFLSGGTLGAEMLDELLDDFVFDVESALYARMVTRLRAEERAVLEIQERELVGLLRDVEARDAVIQQDLEEARQFQRKMLGPPPKVPGAELEVVYKPLGLVGGDLYAASLEGNRLRLFIADATGHGVRAALTTMFIKSGYETVRGRATDPAALLSALNDAIAQTYRSSEMLFSAACVDVDLVTGAVAAASAAHPPICVVRGGKGAYLDSGGAFLGVRSGMKYSVERLTLEPGDGLYLFTDGFTEARKQNVQFGDETLLQTIVDSHQKQLSPGEAVERAVNAFLDGTPMDDDGTFVGLRFRGDAAPLSRP